MASQSQEHAECAPQQQGRERSKAPPVNEPEGPSDDKIGKALGRERVQAFGKPSKRLRENGGDAGRGTEERQTRSACLATIRIFQ